MTKDYNAEMSIINTCKELKSGCHPLKHCLLDLTANRQNLSFTLGLCGALPQRRLNEQFVSANLITSLLEVITFATVCFGQIVNDFSP